MIGDRVKELRDRRGWTQAHLAGAAEISLRTVQRLEQRHSHSAETLLAVAAALDIDARGLTEPSLAASSEQRPLWRAVEPATAGFWADFSRSGRCLCCGQLAQIWGLQWGAIRQVCRSGFNARCNGPFRSSQSAADGGSSLRWLGIDNCRLCSTLRMRRGALRDSHGRRIALAPRLRSLLA